MDSRIKLANEISKLVISKYSNLDDIRKQIKIFDEIYFYNKTLKSKLF